MRRLVPYVVTPRWAPRGTASVPATVGSSDSAAGPRGSSSSGGGDDNGPLPPPHGLEFAHLVGSGRFSLSGTAPATGDRVFIEVVVGDAQVAADFGDAEAGEARDGRRRRRSALRRRFPGEQRRTVWGVRAPFHAFIVPPPGSRRGAAVLDVIGVCLAGHACIDGVAVLDGASVADAGATLEGLNALRDAYRGPLLQQRHLAELITGIEPHVDPLVPPRAAGKFPFQHWMCAAASPFARFGHLPVHTVPPPLYEALSRYCSERLIDDDLAQFIQRTARVVQAEERTRWERDVAAAVGLAPRPPPA